MKIIYKSKDWRMNFILTNYKNILKTVDKSKLIIVTKTIEAEKIRPILEQGHILFGENKVQEAVEKWKFLQQQYKIELHMLGNLQSNKVKQAIKLFDVIQSLHNEKIAILASEAEKFLNKKLEYYIQVNTGEEPQKSGIAPQLLCEFVNFCKNLGLNIQGLMCIPPVNNVPGIHFALLKKLAQECSLNKLSMGMSQDYQIALQFDASYVRLGTAIFGNRV